MPRIQTAAPPPPQPQPFYFPTDHGASRFPVQVPAWGQTNPVPGFRHASTEQLVPVHATGSVQANTTHTHGPSFRHSQPPPSLVPVPSIPIPYSAPTSWLYTANTELNVNKDEQVSISRANQATSIPSVQGDQHPGQADPSVVSQANVQQQPAVSDQQLQEQQGQQLPEQAQQHQELVTSELVSDL